MRRQAKGGANRLSDCLQAAAGARIAAGAQYDVGVLRESGLKDVQLPCVAQAYVPNNAVLYKLFIIGERYFMVARPSLKNFTAGEQETIFFDSQHISKDGSNHELTKMRPVAVAAVANVDETNSPVNKAAAAADGSDSKTNATAVVCTDRDDNNVAPLTRRRNGHTDARFLPLQRDDAVEFGDQMPPPDRQIRALVGEMRRRTQLANFGMDLIVERTGARRSMVIDVNCFHDFSCLCCDAKINGDECDCSKKEFDVAHPPLYFSLMLDMIRTTMKSRKEQQKEKEEQGEQRPSVAASVALLAGSRSAVNIRSLLLDSGIGSATSSESETSDNNQRQEKARKERAAAAMGFSDWTRIKQFYGIPKPPSLPGWAPRTNQQGVVAHPPVHARRQQLSPSRASAAAQSSNEQKMQQEQQQNDAFRTVQKVEEAPVKGRADTLP